VRVTQRFENAHRDVEDRIVRQPAAALTEGGQELGEGDAVHVLEHEHELLLVLEEVVSADDVGVVELGADRRLAGELFHDSAVLGGGVRDQLEHDLAGKTDRSFSRATNDAAPLDRAPAPLDKDRFGPRWESRMTCATL